MDKRNLGCSLDLQWLEKVIVNLTAVNEQAKKLIQSRILKDEHETAWLLKAITCIDLTTLAGDDTHSNVSRLCRKVLDYIFSGIILYIWLHKRIARSLYCGETLRIPNKAIGYKQYIVDNRDALVSSVLKVIGEQKELPLYGSGGFKFLWDTKFDAGMVAFLDCLQQFKEKVEQGHKDFRLPYQMNKGKIEDSSIYSIKIQFNSEEQWTKALKFMLTNLKWSLAWVSSQFNDEDEATST